jgi:biopolymer transport protein TolQ
MQLNYLELFLESNIIVQIVIVLLIFYSFSSWSIIIEKLLTISPQISKLRKFESFYIKIRGNNDSTVKTLVSSGDSYSNLIPYSSFRKMRDFVVINNDEEYSAEELRNLIEQHFNLKMRSLEKRLDKLGTIATAAPFIGLIGTVCGIINSFQAIGETKSVSLTAIAPGIAEALFTTALGLIVAIPAMIFYNKFTSQLDSLYNSSEVFFNDISMIIYNIVSKKK